MTYHEDGLGGTGRTDRRTRLGAFMLCLARAPTAEQGCAFTTRSCDSSSGRGREGGEAIFILIILIFIFSEIFSRLNGDQLGPVRAHGEVELTK